MSRMASSTSAISFICAVLYLVKSSFVWSFSLYVNSFFRICEMVVWSFAVSLLLFVVVGVPVKGIV